MSDIFREVDEELRRSQLEQLWKKYGNYLIAAAAVVVLGVAAYRAWDYYHTISSQAAGGRFQAALDLAAQGKGDEAEKAFTEIAADAPSGYRVVARFRAAGELGRRDADAAAKAFRELAADSGIGRTMQDLARLRAAMLESGKGDPKAIIGDLEPLTVAGNPWRNIAREMSGVLALKAGDYEAAGRWFDLIVVDPDTTLAQRRRAQELSGLVAAGPLKPKS